MDEHALLHHAYDQCFGLHQAYAKQYWNPPDLADNGAAHQQSLT